ncbi:MAG: patatin-like phospholipase family protein [Chloroflexota bacterium]
MIGQCRLPFIAPPRQMAAVNGRSHVGLALGGGVVRGFAHVGVLSVLDEAGIPIDYIAGASVGAIIGAAYATGMKLPHIAQMAEGLQWLRLAKPVLSRDGLVSFAKLEAWLAQTFGHLHFEDLTHPFVIVATDLETAEPVVLDSGPLAPAIRASCSVPGVVTPLRLNGRLSAMAASPTISCCCPRCASSVPITSLRRHLPARSAMALSWPPGAWSGRH